MNSDDDKIEIGDRLLNLHLGELDDADRAELEAKLAASPETARRLALETQLHQALKARLQRVPAPPGLETRIRASLDSDSGISPAVAVAASREKPAWYRHPFAGALAAAALLSAFLFVNADQIRSFFGNPATVVPIESAVVTVVDQTCDELGQSIAQQKLCAAPSHLNALRLPDGRYWQISTAVPAHRSLVTDRELRGHQLAVAGRFYAPIDTFEIQTLQDLGETLQTAALHLH